MKNLTKEELLQLKPGSFIQPVGNYFSKPIVKITKVEGNILRLETSKGKKTRVTINRSFNKQGTQTTSSSGCSLKMVYFLKDNF
jgi:hypothetical protein